MRRSTFTRFRVALAGFAAVAFVAALSTFVPTPAAGATCPCTIWASTATPATPAASDNAAVELGVKFRADVNGEITGIRFYKGNGNNGSHVGHLWTAAGASLGTATFSAESATGWQQASFPTPIPVTAGTVYVASYYAPVGRYSINNNYFTNAGVDAAPLHALQNGVSGGNGVYRYGTGGGFPTNTYQSSNYWVDVVFTTSAPDTTPPTVTARTPASGATGVVTNSTVTATFSEPVQAGTVQAQLTGPAGAVSGSTTYSAGTQTATFTPAAALTPSTTYTAQVSGAADAAGNAMLPISWSFTTGTGSSGCPCTVWPNTATPPQVTVDDNSAVELGVRVRSSIAGYITGLRFYKGASNTGPHVGSLWTNTGTKLSSVTFGNETASGWQTATLPAPIAITANTTYVASYHTTVGFYSVAENGFASPVTRGPLTAVANGTEGNGLYRYGGSAFPTDTYQASNYFVDVVFDTTAADTTPPTLTARTPVPGATSVPTATSVTATFSEPVAAATVAMSLTGPGGPVTGTVGYDVATTTATFTPAAPLAFSTGYTAAVSGATDTNGNAMAPVSWSFTTGTAPPTGLDQGPGGPVLVVKSGSGSASPFSPFLAEILRAEGLNEFATADLSTVTSTVLNGYDVVLLGSTPLTAAQVTMFTNWVTAGGNLVAFRPDKQLAGLLGLTSTTTTLANGYLRVDTASAPGAGITNQTVQFHGTADRYTLGTARAVATLYSSATAATVNPAVSLVNVGSAGGQAAAFTYDLPQSIVYARQGNPAWDGDERDGVGPVRSDDLYFGGSSTDWVDLTKVAIPQADEQQRLLANLIGSMNLDRKPLPKLWYFPRGAKAVVVATGDDHANGGTAGRFNQYTANSPAGCVVANWECPRFTSYVFPDAPLSNSQAATYTANGFEVGLHPQNGCSNYSPESLEDDYSGGLADWAQEYPSLPSPVTNRYHCLVWSDWFSQPTVQSQHGIRLDVNYYYWPGGGPGIPNWIQDRPGFMTGSGIPMRFANTNGAMIDVYQAPTQMTDESGQSYPFTPDTLLNNALGSLGYYGAFVANMHTDSATTGPSNALLTSALSRGVPLVTAKQLLSWVDGRNSSSFTGLNWSANTLAFTVNLGAGANGATGMVPTVGPNGTTLTGLTRAGSPVSFTRTTVKGVEYAMFTAAAGNYAAAYGAGAAAAVSSADVQETTDRSATVSVASTPATRTEVAFGTSPDALTSRVADGTQGRRHTLTLTGLRPSTTYYYRVTVAGPGGKRAVSGVETLVTDPRDVAAPRIDRVAVAPLPDGTVTATWRTDEQAAATLLVGTRPSALQPHGERGLRSDHSVVAGQLRPGTTYYYRVKSVDAVGNVRFWPAQTEPPARFVAAANGVADQAAVTFRMGQRAGTAVGSDDAVRLAGGATRGRYVSRVLDAQQMVTWDRLTYRADLPAGTSVRVSVRTGSTSRPGAGWSAWTPVGAAGRVTAGDSRYVQYRVELVSRVAGVTPALRAVGITNNGTPRTEPGES